MKYKDITSDQSVRYLVVDTFDDISSIPSTYSVGSICKVIDTGDTYILNSQSRWILQPKNTTGGNTPSQEDVIYNGQTPLYWGDK